MKQLTRTLIILVLLSLPSVIYANSDISIQNLLSTKEISLWKEKSFKNNTTYKSIDNILTAKCDGTASAFYRDIKIDLTKTPILKWSWKINNIHDGLDDISKAGDDYAARIYVVYKKGLMPWSVRALNYVWANKQQKQNHWFNAFTNKAIMIAQESGTPKNKDVWIEETRNIRDDFKKYFNLDVAKIDGIALMTDCDNAHGKAISYYKNIHFLSK